jgi:hypothetical protein
MQLIQNLKQKSIARNTMIVLAAVTLGTVVATDALAAGHGGGGGIGGGHIGGGLGGTHVGGGFDGAGLAGGHIGGGFVSGPMGGDHPAGHRETHLGSRGVGDSDGLRMGGSLHDTDHDRDHHGRIVVVPGYGDYDDEYDYAGNSACFQYRNVHTTAGWRWRQVWVCN